MSSTREIASQCHISVGSLSNIKRKMNLNIKGPARVGKCGSKKRANLYNDRVVLLRTLKKEPLLSTSQLKSHLKSGGISVSERTFKRCLLKAGCKSVRPIKVPKL